jgi:alcohol dehydrogenase
MLDMIRSGTLEPESLIGKTVSLEESPEALTSMTDFALTGVTVIDRFLGIS